MIGDFDLFGCLVVLLVTLLFGLMFGSVIVVGCRFCVILRFFVWVSGCVFCVYLIVVWVFYCFILRFV